MFDKNPSPLISLTEMNLLFIFLQILHFFLQDISKTEFVIKIPSIIYSKKVTLDDSIV